MMLYALKYAVMAVTNVQYYFLFSPKLPVSSLITRKHNAKKECATR